ncbi:MAG: biopolymer transporter ExbD [Opitutaceae bacterium]|nr:biopolymer transporter ExbD [Opitutaceae bacterium]
MTSAAGGEGDPEFQIAPMIDVLLVLLIFFMSIASTAVNRYDPSIELPVAADAAAKEDSLGELVFNVAWNARDQVAVTTFEERTVEPAGLIPELSRRVALDPTIRVLIRGDGMTPVRFVNAVVEAAAEAGVLDINFAAVRR